MALTVPVLWVQRHDDMLARGYGDQGLLEAVFDHSLWKPPAAFDFEHIEVRGDFPDVEGAVVAINCRTHVAPGDVRWFHRQVDRLKWSVLLLCGDEEWGFPWQEFPETATRKVWVMQPRPEHAHLGKLPGGWYPRTFELLKRAGYTDKPLAWFFGGQITHERRQAAARVLRTLDNGYLVETERYCEEGISRADYFVAMADAKVIPCPSGPHSVDCARAFEALEAGCIPIADTVTAYAGAFDYWSLLLGDHRYKTHNEWQEPRFPRIVDWDDFPLLLSEALADWPRNANRVYAGWQQWKRQLCHRLHSDIAQVWGFREAKTDPNDLITVIVTTSPVPIHPETEHLEQTIESIRAQLPTAEIILVADGVRPEQSNLRPAYEEYLRRVLWLCNFEWSNVVPVVLDEWVHQAGATRMAMQLVTTPLVLFVEHDTPLVGEVPWPNLCTAIGDGAANMIQFHENTSIHPDHERVFLDPEPRIVHGVPMRRTAAWWQRPHLAFAELYRVVLSEFFPKSARTMIEDRIYGEVWVDCTERDAWSRWKLWVYTPEGDMRRSGHLDSRGDAEKYEMYYGANG